MQLKSLSVKLKSLGDKNSYGIKVFKDEVTIAKSRVCEHRGAGGFEINKPFISLVTR